MGWTALGLLLLGWVVSVSYGAFHPIGRLGLGIAFLAGLSAFVLPLVWRRSKGSAPTE